MFQSSVLLYFRVKMTDTFVYKDPSKGKHNATSIEGMYILPEMTDLFLHNGKAMLEHIEDIKSMTLRNDDVFICAYQKSAIQSTCIYKTRQNGLFQNLTF